MQVTPPGKRPFPTPPTPNALDLESATFANRGTVVLPDEMVTRILMYLETTDIAVCRSVSRQWQTVIDARHLLARSFYRDCHLTQRINSLAAQRNLALERYHSYIRGWLTDFGDRGRETEEHLDSILKYKHFSEVLFFFIPKLLLNSNMLTYQNIATIRHSYAVRDASFSPDGKYLVTVSSDKTAKLLEFEGGKWQEKATLRHSAWVMSASFSPDGKFLMTTSHDHISKIWRLEDDQWQEEDTIQHSTLLKNASFSPDGKHLVTVVNYSDSAKIWWYEGGKWQEKVTIEYSRCTIKNAQFSPDGKHLVIATAQGYVKIWKLDDGHWEEKFTIRHCYRVKNARFSPDGKHLLTIITSDNISGVQGTKLWELVGDQWQEKVTIEHSDVVKNAHFSLDGKHFVTASRDGTVKICGLEGGKWQLKATIWHACPVVNASFSRDGKLLVTASHDGAAKICGLVGGRWQEIVTIGHSEAVRNASFGPDYQIVTASSSSYDSAAKIWVLKKKKMMIILNSSQAFRKTHYQPISGHGDCEHPVPRHCSGEYQPPSAQPRCACCGCKA